MGLSIYAVRAFSEIKIYSSSKQMKTTFSSYYKTGGDFLSKKRYMSWQKIGLTSKAITKLKHLISA